jgi:hypothetical protein
MLLRANKTIELFSEALKSQKKPNSGRSKLKKISQLIVGSLPV